jgi:hypothetical protein
MTSHDEALFAVSHSLATQVHISDHLEVPTDAVKDDGMIVADEAFYAEKEETLPGEREQQVVKTVQHLSPSHTHQYPPHSQSKHLKDTSYASLPMKHRMKSQ